jgi:hypothetical protein
MEIYNGVMPMEIDIEDYSIDNSGNIYIVKTSRSIENNENIYKLGRTKNIPQRMTGYDKGSQLLFSIYTKDVIKKETELLRYLSQYNYKNYGKEYFKIDLELLKKIIINNVEISDCINLLVSDPSEKKSNKRKYEDLTDSYVFSNIKNWIYKEFNITKNINDKISATDILKNCKFNAINITSPKLQEYMKYLGIIIVKEGNKKFYAGLQYNMLDL